MTDTPNDETEARLRAALTHRADSVEPSAGTEAGTVRRMAAARDGAARRRTLLAAAAVVAVVALAAGVFALTGDDAPDTTELATGGATTTTSTSAPASTVAPASDLPVIWPLPTMSVTYADPEEAAEAFATGYLGLAPECTRDLDPSDGIVLVIPSPEGCELEGELPPGSASTTVAVEERELGWVVTGAESSWLEVAPAAGAVVGADIEVTVDGAPAEATLTASVPPLGQEPGASPSVDSTTIPRGADGSWRLVLGAADGPTVLRVSDGATATARVFTVDGTGATVDPTVGPGSDDGVPGWPGAVARRFDDPESAAIAFVTDVLGFGEPTLQGSVPVSDVEVEVTLTSNPQSRATTTVTVHDTGDARGWVVRSSTASNGVIERFTVNADVPSTITVVGTATAFEATVNVRVLDAEGNVLGETTAQAGANGEVGAFEAPVPFDPTGEPFFVQVAEGDASGRSLFSWGVVRPLAS